MAIVSKFRKRCCKIRECRKHNEDNVSWKNFCKIFRPDLQFIYHCSSAYLFLMHFLACKEEVLTNPLNKKLIVAHCSVPNQLPQVLFNNMRTRGLGPVSIFYLSTCWLQRGFYKFSAKGISEKLAYMICFMHYSIAMDICQFYKLIFHVSIAFNML